MEIDLIQVVVIVHKVNYDLLICEEHILMVQSEFKSFEFYWL